MQSVLKPTSSGPLYYQVGVFALVRSKDSYLTVEPHQPLLPGAVQLPGLLLGNASGAGLAETGLRRALLSQVGLSIGPLSLVGSFAVRLPEGDSRLSLIFGSEYVSGILNPSSEVRGAHWYAPPDLRGLGAPEWLFSAIQEYGVLSGGPPGEADRQPRKPLLRSILGRREE